VQREQVEQQFLVSSCAHTFQCNIIKPSQTGHSGVSALLLGSFLVKLIETALPRVWDLLASLQVAVNWSTGRVLPRSYKRCKGIYLAMSSGPSGAADRMFLASRWHGHCCAKGVGSTSCSCPGAARQRSRGS